MTDNEMVIMRGLPGSGKTTLARNWVSEDPEQRIRTNRDDLRAMAHSGEYSPNREQAIVAARDACLRIWLERGFSVVVDDTNLRDEHVFELARTAAFAEAEWRVWDLTDVPVDTCIERDRVRDRSVGRDVIERMWQRHIFGNGSPLPVPKLGERPHDKLAVTPYTPPAGAPPAVIVDVDGTAALMQGRDPFDESRVHEDLPNEPVWFLLNHLADSPRLRIIFMTARMETCRQATAKWLIDTCHKYGVLRDDRIVLIMRDRGDQRNDRIVKAELFDEHVRHNFDVQLVLDDRDRVVQLWREMGLPCFQVAPGNF